MSGRLPDFLIIGAQKAGTSWLHARLREQPGLWLPADKDYEYFSYPGATPPDAYRARFADAPPGVSIGDACASYFWTTGHSADNPGFARDLPGAIDDTLGPQAKYIVLLRDPVERAVSAYLHHIAFGSLDARVSLLDAPDSLGLVEIGLYGRHLGRWLDVVEPHRICVLPAPGERPPGEVLDRAVRFLGGSCVDRPGHDAPVFEGTPRRRDERGVWVPADGHGLAEAMGPRIESEGRQWVRVVDAATLDALAEELAPDRVRLRRHLEAVSIESGWLDRWTRPSG